MNTQPANLFWSIAASAAWLLLCAAMWRRARARRRDAERAARGGLLALEQAGSGTGRVPVLVAYASQTGTAESLANQTANALQTAGVEARPVSFARLELVTLQSAREVLFIVSTYGEGDPPDPAAHFFAAAMGNNTVDLSHMQFGLLALGDNTYRNFCGFGRQLDAWLLERGARPLFERIEANNADPAAVQAWRRELGHIAATTDLPEWQDIPFEPWLLRKREHLNPGSAGGPVFHLELERQTAVTTGWQAGDLLQIQLPADPDRPRDYSIASIPADGAVHLLIRREVRADGSTGLASGWLTRDVEIGATVYSRLRTHSSFRIGDNADGDLILIGNGTGLAGLRAHLKQRASGAGSHRHWLIFGERQAAHDALYAEDLAAWRASGLLTQLDLVYSRDGAAERYVQDRLRAQSAQLREWVEAGAAIYVCGSLEGMAEAVAEVLREALGESTLLQLQQQGRYRRDVY